MERKAKNPIWAIGVIRICMTHMSQESQMTSPLRPKKKAPLNTLSARKNLAEALSLPCGPSVLFNCPVPLGVGFHSSEKHEGKRQVDNGLPRHYHQVAPVADSQPCVS